MIRAHAAVEQSSKNVTAVECTKFKGSKGRFGPLADIR